MTRIGKGCKGPGITRRAAGLAMFGAVAKINAGHGQQPSKSGKASKLLAGYIEKPLYAAQTCVQCHFYIDPDDCLVVEGPVSPTGYCNYYTD